MTGRAVAALCLVLHAALATVVPVVDAGLHTPALAAPQELVVSAPSEAPADATFHGACAFCRAIQALDAPPASGQHADALHQPAASPLAAADPLFASAPRTSTLGARAPPA